MIDVKRVQGKLKSKKRQHHNEIFYVPDNVEREVTWFAMAMK